MASGPGLYIGLRAMVDGVEVEAHLLHPLERGKVEVEEGRRHESYETWSHPFEGNTLFTP